MTALELGRLIKERKITVMEAVSECIERIEHNRDLMAFISINENALNEAERVQRLIDEGVLTGPLAGVPIAIKDNICTSGLRTTCGSKMLEDFVPQYDATVIERIREHGMIIVGKTNMDEFAMGSTGETSYFGTTRNPYDTMRVAGGSSSGSACAVAAGLVPIALGSDTGGSVRQPAAFCGTVGFKPTYGAVSRYGLIAYASSFDEIGIIGQDMADTIALEKIIAGPDERDSTTEVNQKEYDYVDNIKGLRIGVLRDLFEDVDKEITDAIDSAINVLSDKGAIIEDISLKYDKYYSQVYYTIACAEASSNLARYDGVKYGYRAKEYDNLHDMYKRSRSEGFGREVKRRIMTGSYILSEGFYDRYYQKALKIRRLIKDEYNDIFSKYDCVVLPCTVSVAPVLSGYGNSMEMYIKDVYTVAANLCGLPAVSIPVGKNKAGMPLAIQLMSDCFREDNIVKVALSLEKEVCYE